MKLFYNSHDRESWEWPELFAKADPRFKVVSVTVHSRELENSHGPTMALVAAEWQG
jgi:hypothetical protein